MATLSLGTAHRLSHGRSRQAPDVVGTVVVDWECETFECLNPRSRGEARG